MSGLQWPLIQVRSRARGLKELRMKRGMTQRELAEKVGMSGGNIAAIECGRRSEANLTLATAIKLCDALRVRNPRKLLDSDSETSAD
ncbi:helix-turn-helix domain-containing protein [Bifidobacterium longum]|nr:helix-turn-helix transcriptional regulator [Bifidobacterium longum]